MRKRIARCRSLSRFAGVLTVLVASSVARPAFAQEQAEVFGGLKLQHIPGCVELIYEAKKTVPLEDRHTFDSIVSALDSVSRHISKDGKFHKRSEFAAQGYTAEGSSVMRRFELRRRAKILFCVGASAYHPALGWTIDLAPKVKSVSYELNVGGEAAGNLLTFETVQAVANSKAEFEAEVEGIANELFPQFKNRRVALTSDEVMNGLLTIEGVAKPIKFKFDGREFTVSLRIRSKREEGGR